MDRPRTRKTLSLERESVEPLSTQDVRDSVMDRHTFDVGTSPRLHRPTPVPQAGTPKRQPSASPHFYSSHELREEVETEDSRTDQLAQIPLSNGVHELPSEGLHSLHSNNMNEALLGPGSIGGRDGFHFQEPGQPSPDMPHHRRYGSASHQGSMEAAPHHRRFGSHEGTGVAQTPRHHRFPSGSHQDTNGDVDSANGSPVTEPGGETSLASHEHVGNCEAKDIAVMPLHAKDGDVAAVVRFLRTTQGLSFAVIGELLGDSSERCQAVLDRFVASFAFTGLPFETALRGFLETFRLPGESQKIYRILQAFSVHYWAQCGRTSPFRSEDAVLTLSFSAVILNTDIHNPAVKHKMTEDQFVHNNRGINDGQDFAPNLLSELYQNIKQQGLRVPAGSELPSQLDHSSALMVGGKHARPRSRCCCF